MKIFRLSNNCKEHGREMCSLGDIVQVIKHDENTKKICNAIRTGNLTEEKAKELKGMLKTVEFHSITENHRRRDCIKEFTGYVCIDLDDEGVDYTVLREKLVNDETLKPTLVFTSPSGKLKVVLHLSQLSEASEEEWDDYYKQCVIYIAEKHGVVADKNCKDPVRLCFLSHDDDPYYDQDEPFTVIPFYPVGSEDVALTYAFYTNDKEKGYKTHDNGGYNNEMYSEWLNRVKGDLIMDGDDYAYNKNKEKVFIGSVSGGTAVNHNTGFLGYAMKFRLSVCAMWLYGNNTAKAQRFIENRFEDANDKTHPWNRCSAAHSRFKPEKDVLLWLLKTFEFKSLYELPKTTFEFAEEIRTGFTQKDVTLAEKWNELDREYGFPNVLNDIMYEKNINNEYKDLRLYSALVTMSGFARNTTVDYNDKETGLNLTLNVIGSSASGKGEMSHQVNAMLKSMDDFSRKYNTEAYKKHKRELFAWNKQASQQTASQDGFDLIGEQPEPPTVLINQTNLTTSKGWAMILKQNNGKMVLVNTEYSNLVKMENGKYGGLLSQMKNLFDNDDIGNISATELAKGNVETVHKPNCGVLLSGTFGQFHDLYTSFEDGLLTRSLFYIMPEKEFELQPTSRIGRSERETLMEKFFVAWHLNNQFSGGIHYVTNQNDFETVKGWIDPFIMDFVRDWDTGDEIGSACRSLLYRFPHIVFKVAALLQDLKGFEKGGWNKDDDRTPLEMLLEPTTFYRSGPERKLVVYGKYTSEDYVRAQNHDWGFVADEDERDVFEQGSMPYPLERNWIEAAWKLLMPSLLYGLRMLGTYRREDNAIRNVNPLKGQAKYMALELCDAEFRYSDYKKMVDLVRKKDTQTKRFQST